MHAVRTGCAGWSIPKAAAAPFPAGGSHLERYAALFNAVEINSSFYRAHQPHTYARWAASVPQDFRFAVKAPRRMSHDLRLAGCKDELAQFAAEVHELGEKLGCVLVQLPPSLAFDAAAAKAFFRLARKHFDCMVACEARHASWFGDDATTLLRSAKVTRVMADPVPEHVARQAGPHVATTKGAYMRLHGSPRIYFSSYSEAGLDRYAAQLRAAPDGERWCIFDNTASGAAVPNALDMLQRMR